ncbi:acid-activated periplasmic chaperone HdeA [Pantoea sp. 1.19]|uniref:acid-activated periplasmic chaperone HdeA n=1 Tax=Pantoea sp. 1.19 TaxID=1925589 RepID=UPI000948B712|nr:acid-activated periplasmic chaperone HdeA [Pantoea sp. 1.19]
MKKIAMMIVTASLLAPVASFAKDAPKPVNSWTCEDFLALDESYQPTAVGFAEALNSKGKAEEAVMDVDGIAKVTPLVTEVCEKNKTASFKDKVKDEWHKIKKEM